MKTAMQELIIQLQEIQRKYPINNSQNRAVKGAYVDCIIIAKTLLAKEKQDIIDAHTEGQAKKATELQQSHPPMSAEQTVEQLREAAKNHPDTFLAGALYILDNGMGTATQYSSGAIHSLGEFPATKSMSAEQVLFTFIQAIKDEFKDGNWDYLDFIAKRVLSASPTVKAEGWVEQAKNSFELIVKWCEDSGLKQCDIGNKKHMAIYHSLHAAKDALNNFLVCTPPTPTDSKH